MSTTIDETVQTIIHTLWQQIATHNNWKLVAPADEAAFLAEVQAELQARYPDGTVASPDLIGHIVRRVYSQRIYAGLEQRQERAAHELWLACLRIGLKSQTPRDEAEELAQETVTRVLAKLSDVRDPQSLIAWVLMVFRTVQRDHRRTTAVQRMVQCGGQQVAVREVPLESYRGDGTEPAAHQHPDPVNVAAQVEARMTSERLIALLRDVLPNELERTVVLRLVILGDKPRDVARDLNLPLHRTRVAKSRALAKLRQNAQFMQLVRELAADPDADPDRLAGDEPK